MDPWISAADRVGRLSIRDEWRFVSLLSRPADGVVVSVPRLPTLKPRRHAFTGGMPAGRAVRDVSWRQHDAAAGRRRFGGYGQEARYKSDKVPAPGLEPGRPSFKGWWAANYPTPDCYRSALRNITVSAVPRYRPRSGGGIGRLLGCRPLATHRPVRIATCCHARCRAGRAGRGGLSRGPPVG